MSTRLLLEGPDIEELLQRVRTEHGPSARIVQADKVRSGGLAGFFAKEKYEVEIEIDGDGSTGGEAVPAPSPMVMTEGIEGVRIVAAPAPGASSAPAPAASVAPAVASSSAAPAATGRSADATAGAMTTGSSALSVPSRPLATPGYSPSGAIPSAPAAQAVARPAPAPMAGEDPILALARAADADEVTLSDSARTRPPASMPAPRTPSEDQSPMPAAPARTPAEPAADMPEPRSTPLGEYKRNVRPWSASTDRVGALPPIGPATSVPRSTGIGGSLRAGLVTDEGNAEADANPEATEAEMEASSTRFAEVLARLAAAGVGEPSARGFQPAPGVPMPDSLSQDAELADTTSAGIDVAEPGINAAGLADAANMESAAPAATAPSTPAIMQKWPQLAEPETDGDSVTGPDRESAPAHVVPVASTLIPFAPSMQRSAPESIAPLEEASPFLHTAAPALPGMPEAPAMGNPATPRSQPAAETAAVRSDAAALTLPFESDAPQLAGGDPHDEPLLPEGLPEVVREYLAPEHDVEDLGEAAAMPASTELALVSPRQPSGLEFFGINAPAPATMSPASQAVAALSEALASLPAAPRPPAEAGDVFVIVGEAWQVYDMAYSLAEAVGQDPRSVVLVAPTRGGTGVPPARHSADIATTRDHVQRLRESGAPAVISIDAPFTPKGAAWARQQLDACNATAIWAVVDATRKTGDLEDHLAHLGGVDALIVECASQTRDPGSVLNLGVPVAMLDGRRATRAAWTAVLSAKLFGDDE